MGECTHSAACRGVFLVRKLECWQWKCRYIKSELDSVEPLVKSIQGLTAPPPVILMKRSHLDCMIDQIDRPRMNRCLARRWSIALMQGSSAAVYGLRDAWYKLTCILPNLPNTFPTRKIWIRLFLARSGKNRPNISRSFDQIYLLSAQEGISSYFPHMVPFIDHTLAEYRYNDLGTVGSKIKRKMWSNESLDLVKGRKHSRRGKWYEDCSDKADGWREDWYIPARVIKFYFVSCAPCIVIRIPLRK